MPAFSALIRMVPEPVATRKHLECQRRHGLALRLHDHRHAPHDAVALGLDREQAAPGGGMLQHRHVAQQARETRT